MEPTLREKALARPEHPVYKHNLNELEEITIPKHIEKCNHCEYKAHATNGEWCFMRVASPSIPCLLFFLARHISENNAINNLIKQFPDLER